VSLVSQQDISAFKEALDILRKRPQTYQDCVSWAREQFEKYFNHDVRQLVHVYPLDAKTKDGNLFWSLPKRPPSPLDFDGNNPLHTQCVSSLACLLANVFKIKIPAENPRSEKFRLEVGEMAKSVKVKEFVPDQSAAKQIQASVEKEDKDGEEEKEEEAKQDSVDDTQAMKKEFLEILKTIPKKEGESYEKAFIQAEEFEKDDDANFHIDFIYAMANCRSSCYKLDPMDWIQVKLKAGRIVPAMATTTASIAGLQALELVKILKGAKKVDQRNSFLNLAVPIMQASEPGDLQKIQLTEKISATLWDSWEIEGREGFKKDGKLRTLKDLIAQVETKYEGLKVKDVLKGNTPLYFHAIMNAPGKEKDRERVLGSSLLDLLEMEEGDLEKNKEGVNYVDITMTCSLTSDEKGDILEGVPPVRVLFS